MAITYVGAGTAAVHEPVDASPHDMFPGLPGGWAAGDLHLLAVHFRNNAGSSFPTISGWTELGRQGVGSTGSLAMYYRVAQGGDSAPAVTVADTTRRGCQIVGFRGVDQTTPIGGIGWTAPSSGNSQNIGAITGGSTAEAGEAVIVFGGKRDDWTSVATLTGDSLTWVEMAEVIESSNLAFVWDYAIAGAAGAISNKTFTVTGGAAIQWLGEVVSLKPASGTAHSATPADTAEIDESTTAEIGKAAADTVEITETVDARLPVLARHFDGPSSDELRVANPNAPMTGDITLAALIRRNTDGAAEQIMHLASSAGAFSLALSINATNQLVAVQGFTNTTAGPTITEADGWVWLAITKSAGTVAPRGHVYKGGAWTHFAFPGTLANAPDQTGGTVRFATAYSAVYYSINIAAAAIWDSKLGDFNVEQLTQYWAMRSLLYTRPDAAWQFNQAATTDPVEDLTLAGADQTLLNGTDVIDDGPTQDNYAFRYRPPLGTPDASGDLYTAAQGLGVELHWRLGEDPGEAVTDVSGNDHHGEYIGTATPGATGLLPGEADTAMELDQAQVSGVRALDYEPFVPGSTRTFVCIHRRDLQYGAPTTFAGGNVIAAQCEIVSGSIPGTLTVTDTTGADGSPAWPASGNKLRIGASVYAYTSKDATHFYGVTGTAGTPTPGAACRYGITGHPLWEFIDDGLIRFYPNVDTFPAGWADVDIGTEVGDTVMFAVRYDDATGLCDMWVNGIHKGQVGPDGLGSIPFAYEAVTGTGGGVFQWGYRGDGSQVETFEGAGDEIMVFEYGLSGPEVLELAEAAGYAGLGTQADDTAELDESVAKEVGKGLADTAQIGESVAISVGRNLLVADTISVTEAVSKAAGKHVADTAALSESLSKGFGKSLADTAALAEAVSKAAGKYAADTAQLSDATTATSGLVLNIADTLVVAEHIGKAVTALVEDTATLADVTVGQLNPEDAAAPITALPTGGFPVILSFLGQAIEPALGGIVAEPATGGAPSEPSTGGIVSEPRTGGVEPDGSTGTMG